MRLLIDKAFGGLTQTLISTGSDTAFTLKVNLKKMRLTWKKSNKMSIDPRLIEFLSQKNSQKAFADFSAAQLFTLRRNLQIIQAKQIVEDKGSIIGQVSKVLGDLLLKAWNQEDYRKQKLGDNCRLLIKCIIEKIYPENKDQVPEGRASGGFERLMRQSNPSNTMENVEKFHFNNLSDLKSFSVFDCYAILKTILMHLPKEQHQAFLPLKEARSKEELIKRLLALPDADRALAIDLVSLLWASFTQIWVFENKITADNRQGLMDTANSMLIGAMAISTLFCPPKGSYELNHQYLIELLIDYPTHFEELKNSFSN